MHSQFEYRAHFAAGQHLLNNEKHTGIWFMRWLEMKRACFLGSAYKFASEFAAAAAAESGQLVVAPISAVAAVSSRACWLHWASLLELTLALAVLIVADAAPLSLEADTDCAGSTGRRSPSLANTDMSC
jgi:hypothetical protein